MRGEKCHFYAGAKGFERGSDAGAKDGVIPSRPGHPKLAAGLHYWLFCSCHSAASANRASHSLRSGNPSDFQPQKQMMPFSG
jgi:hypothetical protein